MTDMEFDVQAAQLLEPLQDDDRPAPPPAYDMAVAIRSGSRIRTMHVLAASVAALVVVAIAATAAMLGGQSHDGRVPAAATETMIPNPTSTITTSDLPMAPCTLTTLPLPATMGKFTALGQATTDPTGKYVLESFFDENTTGPVQVRIVLWHDGIAQVLPVPTGGAGGIAVNSSGTVIGGEGFSPGHVPFQPPWMYADGQLTYLDDTGLVEATPDAINSVGDIAGTATDATGSLTAVIWPGGQPNHFIAVPGSRNGFIFAITDDRTLVGHLPAGPTVWRPTGSTWTHQTLRSGTPDPDAEILAIQGDHMVGVANYYGYTFAVAWTAGATTPSYVGPATVATELSGVAVDGDAVGYFSDNVDNQMSGIRLHDGKIERLPDPADRMNTDAVAISTDGHTIVGTNSTHALEWHC